MDLAREIGVTIPVLESTTSLLTAVGRRAAVIRHGVLLVRFAGMERHAFVMSCAFHEARPLEVPPLPGLDAIRSSVWTQFARSAVDRYVGRSMAIQRTKLPKAV
jgi:hypothetical protein